MRAFITGVTGFAGSFLAEHLLSRGDQVLGCSRAGKWGADAPPGLVQSVEVVAWDVGGGLPDEVVRRAAEFAPEAIFHLAAISIPAQCGGREPTAEAIRVNVQGTEAVVALAAALPSRPRVLFSSSCRVYAPVDLVRPRVSEDAPLEPSGAYGKTKLAAEEAFRRKSAERGVEGIVVRAFQHAGPRQSPRLMLSEWCRQFARGESPVRVQNLDSYLDMTDVRDVAAAYRLLAESGQPGEVYNVGSGVARRSGDIFEELRRMHDPEQPFVEISPGRRQEPIADIARLQATVGWRPEIPLETTLRDTLEYWLRSEGVR